MATKYTMLQLTFIFCCLFIISSVGAAAPISTIHPANTVFIGEQGLDITPAMEGDTILGWWASGAAIASSSPDYTISVSNPASFSISSMEFGTHTGNWYHMSSLSKANGTAFSVADPRISLRVEDTTVGVDVTNKWVPTDDELQFTVETNLVPIMERGVPNVPITIKVQTPDGAILSSLTSKGGGTTAIADYPVTTSPKDTGPIWGTSNRATYPPGTYYIWAECNVNFMKDNYDQPGKTISSKVSLLNQDQNPLMGNKGYVTNPATSATTVSSGIPVSAVVTTSNTPSETIPITSVTRVITTVMETIPSQTIQPVTTSVPAKSPGFGTVLAIISILSGMALYLKRK